MLDYLALPSGDRRYLLETLFNLVFKLDRAAIDFNYLSETLETHIAKHAELSARFGFRFSGDMGHVNFKGSTKSFEDLEHYQLMKPQALSDYLFGERSKEETQAIKATQSDSWLLALSRIAFLDFCERDDTYRAALNKHMQSNLLGVGHNPVTELAISMGYGLIDHANQMYREIRESANRMKFSHMTMSVEIPNY